VPGAAAQAAGREAGRITSFCWTAPHGNLLRRRGLPALFELAGRGRTGPFFRAVLEQAGVATVLGSGTNIPAAARHRVGAYPYPQGGAGGFAQTPQTSSMVSTEGYRQPRMAGTIKMPLRGLRRSVVPSMPFHEGTDAQKVRRA
jgi:hypothetical protein